MSWGGVDRACSQSCAVPAETGKALRDIGLGTAEDRACLADRAGLEAAVGGFRHSARQKLCRCAKPSTQVTGDDERPRGLRL